MFTRFYARVTSQEIELDLNLRSHPACSLKSSLNLFGFWTDGGNDPNNDLRAPIFFFFGYYTLGKRFGKIQ